MINRLSNREPGSGHPPGASRERSETQQPTARPCVTSACASDNPLLLPGESSPLLDDQDTTGTAALARNLPRLVLRKIFSQLPSQSLSQCARVCRHWHSCLPALQTRVARWLQENRSLPCVTDADLGRGFSSRTLPFLQAENSVFLHPLTQLLKEQQDSRPTRTGQDARPAAACDPLSGLVQAALHRQLSQSAGLQWCPQPLEWPDGALPGKKGRAFSPCSRWLATSYKLHPDAPRQLILYSWHKGVWQRCLMAPDETEPVERFKFVAMPTDTLLSVHGVKVLAWQKTQDSKTWHSHLVCRMPQACKVNELGSMADGDQIVIASNVWPPKEHKPGEKRTLLCLLFCCPTGNGKAWETIMTHAYDFDPDWRVSISWDAQPQSCQLALAQNTQEPDSNAILNEVHIWRKGLNSSRDQWGCQKSVLPWHDATLNRVLYSPAGHYLLTGLSNGQACLWALDAQYRLHEQLLIVRSLHQPAQRLASQAVFRRDEKQLALALSLSQVQLFDCDANGRWQYGPRLQAPAVEDAEPDDRLVIVQLSSSGRILVRKTHWCVDIWHQDPDRGWLHCVQHTRQEDHKFRPQLCLSQPGELVCTAIEDPAVLLQVYGPDSRGRLVEKTCMPIKVSINGHHAASPDGLSLLLGSVEDPPIALQLVPAKTSEKCRFL